MYDWSLWHLCTSSYALPLVYENAEALRVLLEIHVTRAESCERMCERASSLVEAGSRIHCCCHCARVQYIVAAANYKSVFYTGIRPCDTISHEIGHVHMDLTRTIRL